jgi:hypothetical protein
VLVETGSQTTIKIRQGVIDLNRILSKDATQSRNCQINRRVFRFGDRLVIISDKILAVCGRGVFRVDHVALQSVALQIVGRAVGRKSDTVT